MRWTLICASLALPMRVMAAGAVPPSVQPMCRSPAGQGDIRTVSCALTASESTQRYHFRVTFLGGHDDTRASIEPSLDGRAMSCDAGSKVSLFGEDGEVSLDCRFSVAREAGTTHTFDVTVLWSHAQYKDYAFEAE